MSKKHSIAKSDKIYEVIISSALMFKTRGAYGSYENALSSLMKRKVITEIGLSKSECEKHFSRALKVVDDALEFENRYIQQKKADLNSPTWFDDKTIDRINKAMERYLKKRNPDAPDIFITRSIARIYYFYHLA